MSESSELQHFIFTKAMPNGDLYYYERQVELDPLTGLRKDAQLKLLAVQKYGSDEVISLCPLYGAPKGCLLQVVSAPNNQILALVPYALAPASDVSAPYTMAQAQAQEAELAYEHAADASNTLSASTLSSDQMGAGHKVENYGRAHDEPRFAPFVWSFYQNGAEVDFVPREITFSDSAHEESQAIYGDDGTSVPNFLNVTASISNSILTSQEKQYLLPKSRSMDSAWLPRHRIRAFEQEKESQLKRLKAASQSAANYAEELQSSQLYPNAIGVSPSTAVNPIYAGLRATTSAAINATQAKDGSIAPLFAPDSYFDHPLARQPHMQALQEDKARPSVSAAHMQLNATDKEQLSADGALLHYVNTPHKLGSSFKDFSTPQDSNSSAFISAQRYITAPQKAQVVPRSRQSQDPMRAFESALPWPQALSSLPAAAPAAAWQALANPLFAAPRDYAEPNSLEDSVDDTEQQNATDEAYSENTLITSAVNGTYQLQTFHHNPVLTSSERDERNTITTHHVSTAEGDSATHSNYTNPNETGEHSEHNAAAALRAAGAEHTESEALPSDANSAASQDSAPQESTLTEETTLSPSSTTAITTTRDSAEKRATAAYGTGTDYAPARSPMRTRRVFVSDGSRTQAQAAAESVAPHPALRRSSAGLKPAPVSAQTRAQAQAYIASLQAHANQAVLAVKAAQKIAQDTFGDTYEIPPFQMPVVARSSRLEHLSMPNVNTPLYEDPFYIPSDSAIAFADQHAPYHQAFSHSTSISRYSYGAEFTSQEDKEVRSAKEYQQRVQRLAQAQAQSKEQAQPSSLSRNTNVYGDGLPRGSWDDFVPATQQHELQQQRHDEPRMRIMHHDNSAPRFQDDEVNSHAYSAPRTEARPYTPLATPWWRDQAITEQTAQEAFAEDKYHQSRQGSFIGTPEEFLPEEQEEPITPANSYLNQAQFSPRMVVPSATSESTIVSAPSISSGNTRIISQQQQDQAYVQAQLLAQQQSHDAAAHFAATGQYISPLGNETLSELEPYTAALREEEELERELALESEQNAEINAFTPDSMVLSTPSTVVSGKGAQAEAAAAASEMEWPEENTTDQSESVSDAEFKPSGNTAVERRPLTQHKFDHSFSDFITANGKKANAEAAAADTAAASEAAAPAPAPTASSAPEPEAKEAAPVPATAIAKSAEPAQSSARTPSDAAATTTVTTTAGGHDFSDFKTADGSTVAGEYKIRVISQKQLKAQRASQEAQARAAAEQAERERREALEQQTSKLFAALQKAAQMEVMAAHNVAEQARELARARAELQQLKEQEEAAKAAQEAEAKAQAAAAAAEAEATESKAAPEVEEAPAATEPAPSAEAEVAPELDSTEVITAEQATGPVSVVEDAKALGLAPQATAEDKAAEPKTEPAVAPQGEEKDQAQAEAKPAESAKAPETAPAASADNAKAPANAAANSAFDFDYASIGLTAEDVAKMNRAQLKRAKRRVKMLKEQEEAAAAAAAAAAAGTAPIASDASTASTNEGAKDSSLAPKDESSAASGSAVSPEDYSAEVTAQSLAPERQTQPPLESVSVADSTTADATAPAPQPSSIEEETTTTDSEPELAQEASEPQATPLSDIKEEEEVAPELTETVSAEAEPETSVPATTEEASTAETESSVAAKPEGEAPAVTTEKMAPESEPAPQSESLAEDTEAEPAPESTEAAEAAPQELPQVGLHAEAIALMPQMGSLNMGANMQGTKRSEHVVVIKAEYTHQSLEELSATINSDSSNQPLTYNALNIVSPAYKSQTVDTEELVTKGQAAVDRDLQQMQEQQQQLAAEGNSTATEAEATVAEAADSTIASESTDGEQAEAVTSEMADTASEAEASAAEDASVSTEETAPAESAAPEAPVLAETEVETEAEETANAATPAERAELKSAAEADFTTEAAVNSDAAAAEVTEPEAEATEADVAAAEVEATPDTATSSTEESNASAEQEFGAEAADAAEAKAEEVSALEPEVSSEVDASDSVSAASAESAVAESAEDAQAADASSEEATPANPEEAAEVATEAEVTEEAQTLSAEATSDETPKSSSVAAGESGLEPEAEAAEADLAAPEAKSKADSAASQVGAESTASSAEAESVEQEPVAEAAAASESKDEAETAAEDTAENKPEEEAKAAATTASVHKSPVSSVLHGATTLSEESPESKVIFATPKRFVEKPQESPAHDAVKAMQEAVADVVATSLQPDVELLSEDEDSFKDEDSTLSYLQASTNSSHQSDTKNNTNSLASLAAELIDDFDDPFEDSFSEELQEGDELNTSPRIKRGGSSH